MPYKCPSFSCVAGRAADDPHPQVRLLHWTSKSGMRLHGPDESRASREPGLTIINMMAALSVKAASDLLPRFFLAMLDAWGLSDVTVLLIRR